LLKYIEQGGITGTLVDVWIIFKAALELGATGLILCHHPSENFGTSDADKQITKKLKLAGDSLEIKVWIILMQKLIILVLYEGIF
jgi:DNA repair protein RadC